MTKAQLDFNEILNNFPRPQSKLDELHCGKTPVDLELKDMVPPLYQQILNEVILILKNSSIQFLCFFGLMFASGFLLTLISKWTNNSFRQFRFPNLGLYLFGVVGIPLHEFCHALFAKIFFHDVKSIKWFDPSGKGGSYGTVVHYYNEKNLYHRIGLFFIGMGPVLLAPFFLMGMYYWLVPGANDFSMISLKPAKAAEAFTMSFTTIQNWTSLSFYLFLYLAVCLTSQMELSSDDFKIARGGILPFFIVFLVLNIVASVAGFNLHSKLSNAFNLGITIWSGFFLMGILISLLNFIICFISLSVLNRLFGHQNINPFQE